MSTSRHDLAPMTNVTPMTGIGWKLQNLAKRSERLLGPQLSSSQRREANKHDKLLRFRRAARDIFVRKGFKGATLLAIAAAAGVAFGTLFLYAKDKQDLLLLLTLRDRL